MGGGFFFDTPFGRDPNEEAARRIGELAREHVFQRDIDRGRRNPFLQAGNALLTTATRGLIPFFGKFDRFDEGDTVQSLTGGPVGGTPDAPEIAGLQGFQPGVDGGAPTADPGSEFARFEALSPAQRAAVILDNPETLGSMPAATFDRLFTPQEQFFSGPRGSVNAVDPLGRSRPIVPEGKTDEQVQAELIENLRKIVAAQGAVPDGLLTGQLAGMVSGAAPGSQAALDIAAEAQSLLNTLTAGDSLDALQKADTPDAIQFLIDQDDQLPEGARVYSPEVRQKMLERIGNLETEAELDIDKARADLKPEGFIDRLFEASTLTELRAIEELFADQITPEMQQAIEAEKAIRNLGPAGSRKEKEERVNAVADRMFRLTLAGSILPQLSSAGPRAFGRPGDVASFFAEAARVLGSGPESVDRIFRAVSGGDMTIPEVVRLQREMTNLAFALRNQIILDAGKRISDFEAKRIEAVAGTAGSGNPASIAASFGELMQLSIVWGAIHDMESGEETPISAGIVEFGEGPEAEAVFERSMDRLESTGMPQEEINRVMLRIVRLENIFREFGKLPQGAELEQMVSGGP